MHHALLMWMRISEMHLTMSFGVVRYIVIFKFFSDTFFDLWPCSKPRRWCFIVQQGLRIRPSRGEGSLQQRVPQFSMENLAQGRLRSLHAGEHRGGIGLIESFSLQFES